MPVKDSAITFELNYNVLKFLIKCDNKKVGLTDKIEKE